MYFKSTAWAATAWKAKATTSGPRWRPSGTARQLLAILADGDRSELVRTIAAPTRVIHGRDDPLVPVAAAHDLVDLIPGAVADIVRGMGHDLPLALLPYFAAGIADNAARAAG